jgi:ribonuclease-3
MEALMGAVYLDGGFVAARDAAERLLAASLADSEQGLRLDYKSRLQEKSQALLQQAPRYAVVGQDGPDHAKTFCVSITLGGAEYGRATGRSKKEAEQSAAALALDKLEGPAQARGGPT